MLKILEILKKFHAKPRKIINKIICAILIALILGLNLAAAPVAYAEDPKCPTDDKATDKPIKCLKQGAKCPSGYTEDATKKICNKDLGPDGPGEEVQKDMLNTVALLTGVQAFLNKLIWPVLVLIGGLLENDLLFGGAMEERLRDIWIPMRNLVNILFIIVLVGIALYNILGLGEESSEYSIKTALPKIVVGIIAINFSFLAIKVFLDFVNVMTTSIFALPGNISPQLEKVLEPNSPLVKSFCKNLSSLTAGEFQKMSPATISQQEELIAYKKIGQDKKYGITVAPSDTIATIQSKIKSEQKDEFEKEVAALKNGKLCDADKLTPQGELFLKRYNSRNAAFALALNMGNIVLYDEVDISSLKDVEHLMINTIFSLLLYLVYVASFLALFIVLLGRLVVMWLSVAISPVLLLMIAAPSLKDKFGGFSKISEQFVKNAIAPILIALSMTIGWIMLRAVQGLNASVKFGEKTPFSIDPTNGVPIVGLSTLQDFVVALGTVAVVWLGVFTAAEGTIAQGATDWLKNSLETAGKWIGKLPFKHVPLVPIKLPEHEGHFTISQVGRALETIMTPDDNKLAALLKGEMSKPEDLAKVKDKGELIKTIAGMNVGDFTDKGIKEMDRNKNKYRPIIEKLKTGTGKEPEIARKLEELLFMEKDPVKRKKLAEEIHNLARQEAPRSGPTSTGPTPPAGPKKVGDDGKIDDGGQITAKPDETPTQLKTRVAKINTTAAKISGKIDTTDGTQLKRHLDTLHNSGVTTTTLKQIIGTAEYDKLAKRLGNNNKAKGEDELRKIFGETTPATPAAPPAPSP